LVDVSDNEVTVFGLAHGRSPSPFLNPVLRKRACLEAVTDARIRSTWSSTVFMPMDLGTRLTSSDELLGNVVRPLFICCRLVLVVGSIAGAVYDGFKGLGWDGVLWWAPHRGQKYDVTTAVGRGYLEALSLSGHVVHVLWFPNVSLDLISRARDPGQATAGWLALVSAFRQALQARPDRFALIGFQAGQLVPACWESELPHQNLVDLCLYAPHSRLNRLHIRSTHPLSLSQGLCPFSFGAGVCCPCSGRPHLGELTVTQQIYQVFTEAVGNEVASVCTSAVPDLRPPRFLRDAPGR
jgi:hypothetical protein